MNGKRHQSKVNAYGYGINEIAQTVLFKRLTVLIWYRELRIVEIYIVFVEVIPVRIAHTYKNRLCLDWVASRSSQRISTFNRKNGIWSCL